MCMLWRNNKKAAHRCFFISALEHVIRKLLSILLLVVLSFPFEISFLLKSSFAFSLLLLCCVVAQKNALPFQHNLKLCATHIKWKEKNIHTLLLLLLFFLIHKLVQITCFCFKRIIKTKESEKIERNRNRKRKVQKAAYIIHKHIHIHSV